MKIMLVCAGGMSTGILMKKMQKWAADKEIDLEVKAFGVGEYGAHYTEYDCILLGPQISYKEKEIRQLVSGKPVEIIKSFDYAVGNVDNIMNQVNKILNNN